MTIKEEIQIEEYKRTFAEAYKQGFIDAMSVCKTESQFDKDINVRSKDEPQTECPFDDAIPCEWVNCPNSTDCPYKPKDEPQTERSE